LDSPITVSPKVSDHALVRYLERAKNVDIEALRREILTPERESAIRSGARKIKVDNISFIVRDQVVVTTIK